MDMSGNLQPTQILEVQSTREVKQPTENDIQQSPMDALPEHVHFNDNENQKDDDGTYIKHDSVLGKSKRQVNIKDKENCNAEVILHKADFPWIPSRKRVERYGDTEKLYGKVRSMLNKLTPQNFQTLVKQMSDLYIDTEEKVKGVTDLILEKAISEPKYSAVYAGMCNYLTKVKVPSQTKSGDVNFRAVLLTKCQREFENDWEEELQNIGKKIRENAENEELKAQLETEKIKARKRSTGNIRFIGELFNVKLLTVKIMHDYLFKLLRAKDEESFECFCQLLSTIGKELDTDKTKPRMDQYFSQMEKIVFQRKVSPRMRFMFQDVIEMRLNKWLPRRKENVPKTLYQIRKDVEEEKQAFEQQVAQRGWYDGGGQRYRGLKGAAITEPTEFSHESNTKGKQTIKFEKLSIDPSKLKFSQQNMNGSTFQPDEGVDVNRFHVRNGHDKENTKFERLTIDPSRLDFLKQNPDESTVQTDGGNGVNKPGVVDIDAKKL